MKATRMLLRFSSKVIGFLLFGIAVLAANAAESADEPLERQFADVVQPFLTKHCVSCHGETKPQAKLDLRRFTTIASVVRQPRVWETILQRIEAEEMPPEKAPRHPTENERRAVVTWIKALREREARQNAGDPGRVLARRLSNAEFDHTIRDLTGVDIRPMREFPIDPANEAGFDNSGESLSMSPALLKKYLGAARSVADHLALKPHGFVFAPHPVVAETDRDKYCVQRIVDFYERHQVDHAAYFFAAWKFQHRASLGQPNATLDEVAAELGLSGKYLANVWSFLSDTPTEPGPPVVLKTLWRKLPNNPQQQDVARRECERLRDVALKLRKDLESPVGKVRAKGISDGTQPFVLWRNRQIAAQRMRYSGAGIEFNAVAFEHKVAKPDGDLLVSFAAGDGGDGGDRDYVVFRLPHFREAGGAKSTKSDEQGRGEERRSLRELLEKHAPEEAARLRFGKHPLGHAIDDDSFVLKAPEAKSIAFPANSLFQRPDDNWNFVVEGGIDRANFGGGAVQTDCALQRKLDPHEIGQSKAQYVFVHESDPAVARFEAGLTKFCRTFPDTFAVSSRGAYFDPNLGAQRRLLTAGFHLMQGYFRDDGPLCELVLDDTERRELDALWQELNFITLVPMRQYKDFIFFERAEPPRFAGGAEFDFARSEDKDATSAAKMEQMQDVYLAKARRQGANDYAIEAIESYFKNISSEIRDVEQLRLAAEPSHLDALRTFAEQAYRRSLSAAEQSELVAFYRSLREKDQLPHEDAIRDTVASVLMSPYFCYRLDPPESGAGVHALKGYALASRLSYFLWSSMPDAELQAHAAADDLHKPGVLVAQTRRMLRDEKVRGLATEFAGHWLEFRRFEEHNAVDRERFPSFTNELRQAMYEEPLRFFIDVVSRNRSVLDFLYADDTFVNPLLASHYGMPVPTLNGEGWFHIERADRFGRGGLLPMSIFLTSNSPGLRTSPVKRGYWVVRRMLGEQIPPPPPDVPELPKDEAKLGDLTLPQMLARHRESKACAGCHQRFDSIGLAFEGYGPIGERRERDLGGRPIEPKATYPDGNEREGIQGLRRYLSERRQDDFVDNLCRKLFAYALGRTLLLSDEPAINNMHTRLEKDDYRFGLLVELIVSSPQFLNQRGRDDSRE